MLDAGCWMLVSSIQHLVASLRLKNLNLVSADNEVGEFTFKAGSLDDMVVDPMVIAAAGFAEEDAVVFEAVAVQPGLCDLAMGFGAAGKKIDHVAFGVPLVQHRQGIGIGKHGEHAFGFFVRHVVADSAVDID